MTSYTTLVNVDADIAERVANYLSILLKGEGQAFLASCKTYVQTSATHELVMKFMETTNTILTINEKGNCQYNYRSYFSSITKTRVK